MKKTVLIIAILIILIAGFSLLFIKFVKAPIITAELTRKADKSDLIVVISPVKDSEISSPLSISGRARGSWFFEGSFPITLLDSDRNTIAEGHVTAQGEWMTQDFVKFLGSLQFNNYIKGSNGFLVLKKENPSGLVENNDSIEIPIKFK